jgi:putative membrane protein
MDPRILLSSLIYALLGILIFGIAFVICDKLTPGELWKELIEKQNVAIAILAGCVALGICLIVAAAIH